MICKKDVQCEYECAWQSCDCSWKDAVIITELFLNRLLLTPRAYTALLLSPALTLRIHYMHSISTRSSVSVLWVVFGPCRMMKWIHTEYFFYSFSEGQGGIERLFWIASLWWDCTFSSHAAQMQLQPDALLKKRKEKGTPFSFQCTWLS